MNFIVFYLRTQNSETVACHQQYHVFSPDIRARLILGEDNPSMCSAIQLDKDRQSANCDNGFSQDLDTRGELARCSELRDRIYYFLFLVLNLNIIDIQKISYKQ